MFGLFVYGVCRCLFLVAFLFSFFPLLVVIVCALSVLVVVVCLLLWFCFVVDWSCCLLLRVVVSVCCLLVWFIG